MAIQVTKVQDLGKLPAIRTTFYSTDKPELKLSEGERVSYLRFKKSGSEAEGFTQRESMAVVVSQHSIGKIRDVEQGSEFLQSLIDEAQDQAVKMCADGKCEFQVVQDPAELVKEYFDTSKTASGNRVTMESVGKFFDASMTEWLTARVQAKFPQFDTEKCAKVVAQYRGSFADLAKYQMPHTKAVYQMLEKAWNEWLAESSEREFDTDIADWINGRFKKLADRHNEAEMMVDAI